MTLFMTQKTTQKIAYYRPVCGIQILIHTQTSISAMFECEFGGELTQKTEKPRNDRQFAHAQSHTPGRYLGGGCRSRCVLVWPAGDRYMHKILSHRCHSGLVQFVVVCCQISILVFFCFVLFFVQFFLKIG